MHRYKTEASNLIKLATPVLIASVAQTGMGFVDTVMAGGVSAIDMAAVSIAASIWLPSILFGVGLLMALVPVVAQLNGSGRQEKISFEIQQGAVMALLISIPIVGVLFQTQGILNFPSTLFPSTDFTLSEDLTFIQTTRMSSTDEVLDDHGDYLMNFAVKKTSDRELSVDLIQDTLLSGIENISKFRGDSSIRTWLTSILNRKIIDHWRKKSIQRFYFAQ